MVDFHISAMTLAMVILGGAGSVPGAILGAVLIAGYDRVLIPRLGELLAMLQPFSVQVGSAPQHTRAELSQLWAGTLCQACCGGRGEDLQKSENKMAAPSVRAGCGFERVMGFEPTDACLGSKCLTTWLHPRCGGIITGVHSNGKRPRSDLTVIIEAVMDTTAKPSTAR